MSVPLDHPLVVVSRAGNVQASVATTGRLENWSCLSPNTDSNELGKMVNFFLETKYNFNTWG
jgi:hypothetical protein